MKLTKNPSNPPNPMLEKKKQQTTQIALIIRDVRVIRC